MKKLLIITDNYTQRGLPVTERSRSYFSFFKTNHINVDYYKFPNNIIEVSKLIIFLYKNRYKNILLTMPPFRSWSLLLLPQINKILDIRDGWSISIKNGYGNTTKQNKFKALISKQIEKIAIKFSSLTITCTPGLQEYLQSISKKDILLLTNGYSIDDKQLCKQMVKKTTNNAKSDINSVNFICTGKFSEYGKDKIKTILKKISEQYPEKKTKIDVIGANIESNRWISSFLINFTKNLSITFHNHMDKKELYSYLIKSDIAITIIRDPNIDFGTKIYDYILCGLPIFNYFDQPNTLTEYFQGFFHDNYMPTKKSFLREDILNNEKEIILEKLKC